MKTKGVTIWKVSQKVSQQTCDTFNSNVFKALRSQKGRCHGVTRFVCMYLQIENREKVCDSVTSLNNIIIYPYKHHILLVNLLKERCHKSLGDTFVTGDTFRGRDPPVHLFLAKGRERVR